MPAPVLVIGAGFVGRRLLDALPEGSASGLRRTNPGDDPRIRVHDLDDPEAGAIELPQDAAIVYTVPPDDGDERLGRCLARLSHPPARFVYLSTTGVYGDRGGARVDESTPTAPGSARAARRVAAEQRLDDWCSEHDVPLVVLRVPGIYGPGRLGIDRLKESQPVLAEKDANPGNRIHADDLVACIIAALDERVPVGVYNVGDGDERSSTWFAFELARQLGIEPPPTVDWQTAQRKFSEGRLSFLRESRRVDVTKMREVLKPALRYEDAAAGIAASLAEEAADTG